MRGMGRKLSIALLSVAVLALGSGTALAGWTFTDLSLQGDIVGASSAEGINNNGDIVGIAYFADDEYHHATLWSGGVAYDLGTLGGSSQANTINDAGVIVGNSYILTSPGGRHAALFSSSAPPVDIHPDIPYAIESGIRDINNSGKMGGQVYSSLYNDQLPVRWNDPETYELLDAGPLGMGYVNGINNLGQMTGAIAVDMTLPGSDYWQYGYQAAFWDADGTLTHLGVFDGWISTTGGLNDLGQVLVNVFDDTSYNSWALVWEDGEVVQTLDGLGGGRTEANAINNNGLIVGQSQTADGTWHAVLWQDGEIIDLNDLVSGTDLVLTSVNDINEQGQMVGYAVRDDGTHVAFALSPNLTPTPVPASVLLFGSGLAGLGLFRRRMQG
jgi:probable HAF family extracellular repeat protein